MAMNCPQKVGQKNPTILEAVVYVSTLSIKLKALDLYKQGYSSTTIAKQLNIDPVTIQRWVNKHLKARKPLTKQPNVRATPQFKAQLVRQVRQNSLSCRTVAIKYGVSESAVYSWLKIVKANGYAALFILKPNERPAKTMPAGRPKKQEPQTELEKLKVELERARTENALLKKVIALVEQREAQLRKVAKSGLSPSKN